MKITVPIPEYNLTLRGDAGDCKLTVEAEHSSEVVVVFSIDDLRIEFTMNETSDIAKLFAAAVVLTKKLAATRVFPK